MFNYNKKDFIFAAAKRFIVQSISFCQFIENIENDSAYQLRYKLANQNILKQSQFRVV